MTQIRASRVAIPDANCTIDVVLTPSDRRTYRRSEPAAALLRSRPADAAFPEKRSAIDRWDDLRGVATCEHSHAAIPNSRNLATRYSCGPIALHTVAVGAQQLQVLDIVLATDALGNDVVDLEDTEWELAAASVAPTLLLAEQDVLVLAVRHRRVDVSAPGYVGAGRNEPVVEQVTHGLLQAHVDQLDGLGRDVDADPAPVQVLGSDAGGGATAERVQHDVVFVRRRLDDPIQEARYA